MKRRKVTVAVLSVVLAAAALTGCGSAQQTNGPKKTRVVLNEVAHSIFYAPMYVAIEEGYFEDAGIDLELVTGFGADKTMTAVLTGEADIGFMGSESTIYTYAGGTEDYVVNFAQLTQRAGNFLVAREPIDDFSWDMLKVLPSWAVERAVCRRWYLNIFWRKIIWIRQRICPSTRALTSVPQQQLFPADRETLPLSSSRMLRC